MNAAQTETNHLVSDKNVGTNPIIALSVIIAIAIIMVTVCFIIFLKSGAYETVKQINAGTRVVTKNDLSDYDTTSPIKADDLDKYSSLLKQKLSNLDDESDFGQSGLSNQALGF